MTAENERENIMKNSFVRLLSILLLVLLLFMALASCSQNEEDQFLPDSQADYKDLNPVTLKLALPGLMPKTWPEVKAEFEKETSSTLNVKLDIRWLNTAYYQTINELWASNDYYDAFVCSKPEADYPNFTKFAKEGQIKDITELFPQNALDLYQKFSKQELDCATVDGKLYAVPTLYPRVYGPYIMANAELMKKYSMENIKTLDDYEKYLEAVNNGDIKMIPATISDGVDTLDLLARGSGYVILDPSQMLVYKWDDPEMKILPWEKTPEFKKAASDIISWYQKGYLKAGADFLGTSSFVKYGILEPPNDGETKLTNITKTGDLLTSEALRTIHLFPDNTAQRDNPMGNYFFDASFVFSSKSANTERALMFLDWVHKNSANNRLMRYGIENKDYILKDGYPSLPDQWDLSNYKFYGGWPFDNIEFESANIISQGNGALSPKEFMDESSKYPPHNGFYPNYKDLGSAAEVRAAGFRDFEKRLREGMIKDIIEVDTFILKMEERGSESMAKLVQKQLDEHRKQ